MVYNNILEAVGNTPLIRLNHMTGEDDAEVLVKYEGMNIGGSIKTRTALQMINAAEKEGLLTPDFIMPDSVSAERRLLIKQYGAELILIHDDDNIGECIDRCIAKAKQMQEEDPKVFMPDQFSNINNVRAHLENTALEMIEQVKEHGNGKIDGFCSGFGTGGTITGIGQILKKSNPETLIWVAEPEHAAIL